MEMKTILLVEDDAEVRGIIRDALELDKYKVSEASRYSEALELAGNPLALALIDYKLPDRDGFEVLNALREVIPALPAIIITGHSHKELAIRALRAGVTDYIEKPINFEYLMLRLSEILRGSDDTSDTLQNRSGSKMNEVALHIRDKYMQDPARDDLAKLACMSRHRFSRAFNERFGKTLPVYVNNVKINKAADLLKGADLNITEIAHSVGYGSVVHFEREFRKVYGMPPREYRKRLNNDVVE